MASKSLSEITKAIVKKHGDGAVVHTNHDPIDFIPTGSFLLDLAIGVGGWPRGRLVELYSKPSEGKSTLALATAAEAQRIGEAVSYQDYEHAFDPAYAQTLGVDVDDPDKWILSQPDSLESGMAVVEMLVESNAVGLIIIDSVAAMIPEAFFKGEIGEQKKIAAQASVLSQVLKILVPKINASNVLVIFINHVHEKIGGFGFGPAQKTTPGGEALKFYASIRAELQVVKTIKGKMPDLISGDMVEGAVAKRVRARIVKNKVATPYREGIFYLDSASGISEARSVIEVGVARKMIKHSGARYVLPFKSDSGDKTINLNGLEKTVKWLTDHPDHLNSLRTALIELIKGIIPDVSNIEAVEVDSPTPGKAGKVSLG